MVEVWTHENRPALAGDPDAKPFPFAFRIDALQSDRVRYAGQPIALVVAQTLEAATEAARLLAPAWEARRKVWMPSEVRTWPSMPHGVVRVT